MLKCLNYVPFIQCPIDLNCAVIVVKSMFDLDVYAKDKFIFWSVNDYDKATEWGNVLWSIDVLLKLISCLICVFFKESQRICGVVNERE